MTHHSASNIHFRNVPEETKHIIERALLNRNIDKIFVAQCLGDRLSVSLSELEQIQGANPGSCNIVICMYGQTAKNLRAQFVKSDYFNTFTCLFTAEKNLSDIADSLPRKVEYDSSWLSAHASPIVRKFNIPEANIFWLAGNSDPTYHCKSGILNIAVCPSKDAVTGFKLNADQYRGYLTPNLYTTLEWLDSDLSLLYPRKGVANGSESSHLSSFVSAVKGFFSQSKHQDEQEPLPTEVAQVVGKITFHSTVSVEIQHTTTQALAFICHPDTFVVCASSEGLANVLTDLQSIHGLGEGTLNIVFCSKYNARVWAKECSMCLFTNEESVGEHLSEKGYSPRIVPRPSKTRVVDALPRLANKPNGKIQFHRDVPAMTERQVHLTLKSGWHPDTFVITNRADRFESAEMDLRSLNGLQEGTWNIIICQSREVVERFKVQSNKYRGKCKVYSTTETDLYTTLFGSPDNEVVQYQPPSRIEAVRELPSSPRARQNNYSNQVDPQLGNVSQAASEQRAMQKRLDEIHEEKRVIASRVEALDMEEMELKNEMAKPRYLFH